MYLDEASLVAKTVAAIGSHAVEVSLVLSIAAHRILTVFVEPVFCKTILIIFTIPIKLTITKKEALRRNRYPRPESDVAFGHGLVFEDPHAVLIAQLLRFRVEHEEIDRGHEGPLVGVAGRREVGVTGRSTQQRVFCKINYTTK